MSHHEVKTSTKARSRNAAVRVRQLRPLPEQQQKKPCTAKQRLTAAVARVYGTRIHARQPTACTRVLYACARNRKPTLVAVEEEVESRCGHHRAVHHGAGPQVALAVAVPRVSRHQPRAVLLLHHRERKLRGVVRVDRAARLRASGEPGFGDDTRKC